MVENLLCPQCGHPLDIIFEKDGSQKPNSCTNPDCSSSTVAIPDRRPDSTR